MFSVKQKREIAEAVQRILRANSQGTGTAKKVSGRSMSKHELQKLYDSEINFEISTLWDGGFDWKLGDHLNGYRAAGCEDTFDGAVESLAEAARTYWPTSEYAKLGTVKPEGANDDGR